MMIPHPGRSPEQTPGPLILVPALAVSALLSLVVVERGFYMAIEGTEHFVALRYR
jgi:hypothetical protein